GGATSPSSQGRDRRARGLPAGTRANRLGVALKALATRIGFAALVPILLLNALAFRHAWTFTHMSPARLPRSDLRRLTMAEKAWFLVAGIPHSHTPTERTPRDVGLAFQRHIIPPESTRPLLEAWFIPNAECETLVVLFHGHGGTKSELLEHAHA